MNDLNLSPEEQLLLLNSRTEIDEGTIKETLALLEQPLDWNHITTLAYNHGVAPLIYRNLTDVGVESVLPEELKALYYITASRNNSQMLETGRVITTGEYGGLKGFMHVYENLGIEFKNDKVARKILDLVQYANLHNQKPLTDDELKFIAKYPKVIAKLFKDSSGIR